MAAIFPEQDLIVKHDERQKWGNSLQFLLACIGYSVGLGNIWRFPSLAYQNGGGAFLIPYLCCSFFFGLPILYLEMSLGQFGGVGPAVLYGRLRPVFQGIGWGMAVLSWLVGLYYNVIVAWILVYMYIIITGQTYRWSSCMNDFNTIYCKSILEDQRCKEQLNVDNATFFNRTCYPIYSDGDLIGLQSKINETLGNLAFMSPAEEFFENYVLEKSPIMSTLGGINIKVLIALAISWTLTTLVLWKGVKIIGKVAFFTATTPYIIIAIMFTQSWTLDGHTLGLDFYLLKPDFSVVFKWETWKAAVTQNCYSLGIGFGGLLSLASFNQKHHNCFRDAILVSFADGFMSIFGGVAVFNVLGFMATKLDLDIKNVVQAGTGLAFIAYPEAMSHMPVPWLWSLLFFLMLFLLGVDSQFGLVEVICTSLHDQFPSLRKHEGLMVFGTCFVSFLVGVIMVTRDGIFYFNIFDSYSASLSLVLLLIAEITLVVFIYGCANYMDDLREMFGQPSHIFGKILGPTGWYIKCVWLSISPLLAIVILVVTIISQATTSLTYGKGDREYSFPSFAFVIGWIISLLPLVPIPILLGIQPKWPSYKLHLNDRVMGRLPGWLANIIGFSELQHNTEFDSRF